MSFYYFKTLVKIRRLFSSKSLPGAERPTSSALTACALCLDHVSANIRKHMFRLRMQTKLLAKQHSNQILAWNKLWKATIPAKCSLAICMSTNPNPCHPRVSTSVLPAILLSHPACTATPYEEVLPLLEQSI